MTANSQGRAPKIDQNPDSAAHHRTVFNITKFSFEGGKRKIREKGSNS